MGNVYHIDRDSFSAFIDGSWRELSEEFFGSVSPQHRGNKLDDLPGLRDWYVSAGWMTPDDEIVIDNLDNCLTCNTPIDYGVYCDICQMAKEIQ